MGKIPSGPRRAPGDRLVTPILQMRELRHRQGRDLAKAHKEAEW